MQKDKRTLLKIGNTDFSFGLSPLVFTLIVHWTAEC